MLAVLLLTLLATSVAAPFFGAVSGDTRSEGAHPVQGWYPATPTH